jgi:hypothetical protein
MNTLSLRFILPAVAGLAALGTFGRAAGVSEDNEKKIPEALKAWEAWAVWNDPDRDCPASYQDAKKRICAWPSRLELQVEGAGAHFGFNVTVFRETWVALPGGPEIWPQAVKANGAPLPVVEHEGTPAVRLEPGAVHLEGAYQWSGIPQRIAVPRTIGILALTVDGKPVESPVWDQEGFLWLKRDSSTEEADKNFLSVKLYGALEDGIPLWLRTEVELTVSGKSREEDIGTVIPEGWKLAAVDSPIPAAVDDAGRMKAQVRAGKWTVHLDAFRFDNPKTIRYAPNAKPAATEELIAFRAQPNLRIVEIVGPPSVDVSQTTFPVKWRELPVYSWDTATPLGIEERMRGMGQQKPAGLTVVREWWLDEKGGALTFRDHLSGERQQTWRLDAAAGQELGSVRSGGQGQLITHNPQNGAPGVEVRARNLDLEATGRTEQLQALSAVGWQSDADSLRVTLNLPPGWRLFALFGADWVRGDWLTSWTLLDLFLLLIFSLAVFRLWGFAPAAVAFAAFGLSYHEAGAPRYSWIVLLVPLALQKAPLEGWARTLRTCFKWISIAVLLLVLIPFLGRQIQQALYPQLERLRESFVEQTVETVMSREATPEPPAVATEAPQEQLQQEVQQAPQQNSIELSSRSMGRAKAAYTSNMFYASKTRIQTGPGVPEWKWRTVSFGWNGPVSAAQHVRPVLISLTVERLLTVLRTALLLVLAAILLDVRRLGGRLPAGVGRGAAAAVFVLFLGLATTTHAQTPIPDQATLDTLRTRLLETSDAYPNAAEIPLVSLTLTDRRLVIDAEIHAAVRAAVPLPARLPAWSPVSVLVDEKPEPALRREDGYLWVVLLPGVHHVRLQGSLANVTEWEWTFLLKPRQVKIEAPEWTFSGVRPGGLPEQQVFFVLKQKAAAGQASYERQDVQSLALVDRNLEIGLVWQVHTTVTRLSPTGKAVALRIPLLPGENVLSANTVVKDGYIEIGLGAEEKSFTWESGLAVVNELKLATRAGDSWVERWHLVASPVWNVAITGLPPTFEPGEADLVPLWQPWPGEEADLAISRPEAVPGATVTVNKAAHHISLGGRQRVSKLSLAVRCSLGEDFYVGLPAAAEVTALEENDKQIPVRKDGDRLVIPLHPGEQTISIDWKINSALGFHTIAEQVQLPVEAANIHSSFSVPDNRWVLWTAGPQRGPAVRFWVILWCALLAALALGRTPRSPLRTLEWVLLIIGLTQVWLPAALTVIAWLFLLAWRGRDDLASQLTPMKFNLLQIFLIFLTVAALSVLLVAVGEGLLGNPEMFIAGFGSTRNSLQWFQARSDGMLPQPACFSISIWWYRFAMLLWALWLAAALIRWLRSGWHSFSSGGCFRKGAGKKAAAAKKEGAPPPLPAAS